MEPALILESVEDVAVVDLVGEVDLLANRLERELERLLECGVTRVVVDCTRLAFLDTLVDAAGALAPGSVRVIAPQGGVREILELTYLADVLPLFETRSDALAA